jgi:hypothetical protein
VLKEALAASVVASEVLRHDGQDLGLPTAWASWPSLSPRLKPATMGKRLSAGGRYVAINAVGVNCGR